MANEDVLERAKRWLDLDPLAGYDDYHSTKLIRDLAAALREARKERELIRTLAEQYKADPVNAYDRPSSWGKLDALIDAAMKPPGWEGQP